MIITKLIGGLGNQMFQYAAARRATLTLGVELKLDLSGYENQEGMTPRKYMLDIFNIKASFANKNEVNRLKNPYFFWKLLRKINPAIQHKSYIKEKYFHFDKSILNVGDNSYFEGYWASEKYFKDNDAAIRKEFTFKNMPDEQNMEMLDQIHNSASISVHIRRGDYVSDGKTNQFHGVCGLNYYKRAIKYIAQQVQNPHFYIFSDDPVWVKENIKIKYPCVYVSHNGGKNDYEDMRLMSDCKHNIIANSTFSWWGAWLNNNTNKIVIAPKKWFGDSSINTNDIIPSSWIRL